MIKMVLGGTTLSEIKSSGHGYIRRITLLIELLYLFVVISFTWVAVGAYYLGVMMTLQKILYQYSQVAYTVLRYVYLFHLIMVFIVSLSLKPTERRRYGNTSLPSSQWCPTLCSQRLYTSWLLTTFPTNICAVSFAR